MVLVLIRQFGLAGVGAILLWLAEQQPEAGTKNFLRGLAAACFVAWLVVLAALAS
jgi:hypothetical protein